MKIGIISDIHANLAALQAVLTALDAENCVTIVCAGDVVGYGPSPLECAELVQQRKILCVRGNHDDMMLNQARDLHLRKDVRDAIQWTRQALPQDVKGWLGTLPRSLRYAGFEVLHASHVYRPEWHYVMDMHSVMANFLFQGPALSFNGHTHLPLLALHQRGHAPKLLMLRHLSVPPHHKCLVNVGSVGQPRDRNPEASYVIYETKDRSVTPMRTAYDIADTQERMRKAGLPQNFINRLGEGR
jgi:predicted phosphodiesterase